MKTQIEEFRTKRFQPQADSAEQNTFAAFQLKMLDFIRSRIPVFRMHAEKSTKNRRMVPVDMLQEAGKLGLSAFDIPRELSGQGLTAREMVEVGMATSYESAGHSLSLFIVHDTLTAVPLMHALRFAENEKAELIKKYIADTAAGRIRGFFALTEPERGTDATNLQLSAIRTEREGVKGFLLNGKKQLITNTPGADYAVVAVRTGTPESGKKGISVFLVNVKTELERSKQKRSKRPFKVTKIFDKGGQPGAVLTEIEFDDMFVPESQMLGRENKAWDDILSPTLLNSRIHIAAQSVGVAMRALDEAKIRTAERVLHKGLTLDKMPLIRDQLALMWKQTKLAEYLVYKAADAFDRKDPRAMTWASLAKLVAADTAYWVASGAQEMWGGIGYATDYYVPKESRRGRENAVKESMPIIDKIVNDSKPLRTYEGAANALLEIFVKPFFSAENYTYLMKNVISMPDFRTAHYKKLHDGTDRDYFNEVIERIESMIPLELKRSISDLAPAYEDVQNFFAA